MIADEKGDFNLSKFSETDTLTFSAIGFKKKTLLYRNLKTSVVLDSALTQLSEVRIYQNQEVWLGYTDQKETIQTTNLLNSSLFETGIIVKNRERLKGTLSTIRIKAGFIGTPKLPYRVNVYSIGKDGLPAENLLKKEIIFIPKTKKLKWFEFNIDEQGIQLPEDGICIGLEFLNPSVSAYKLTKNYTPARLGFFSQEFPSVVRTNDSGGWYYSKISTLAAGIKVQIQ